MFDHIAHTLSNFSLILLGSTCFDVIVVGVVVVVIVVIVVSVVVRFLAVLSVQLLLFLLHLHLFGLPAAYLCCHGCHLRLYMFLKLFLRCCVNELLYLVNCELLRLGLWFGLRNRLCNNNGFRFRLRNYNRLRLVLFEKINRRSKSNVNLKSILLSKRSDFLMLSKRGALNKALLRK